MKESKCAKCINGGIYQDPNGSIFVLEEAITKYRTINYSAGGIGCRGVLNALKSKECIKNDFKHYQEYNI